MFRSAAIALALGTFIAVPVISLPGTPARAGMFDSWMKPHDGAELAQTDATVGDLVARIQRLEGQNRQLNGQVEELQNLLRRSLDDFKRYRDDTEFRLQAIEGGKPAGPQKRSEAAPPAVASPTPSRTAPSQGPGQPPRTLGTLAETDGPPTGESRDGMMDDGGQGDLTLDQDGAPPADPSAPMDLGQVANPTAPARRQSGLTPPGLPGVAVDESASPPSPQPQAPGQQTASIPSTPEDEYTADYRLIEGRNYEAAELAFRKFLQSYPNDKRTPDAIHWIGESLFQRQQYRDAAEQFLKVTTGYGTYRRAPSSMLRLGMSLAALGEKEAACATLQEVTRKYPAAPTSVKSGVDRETAKNGC
jgi:tol-pal system protein YbgF